MIKQVIAIILLSIFITLTMMYAQTALLAIVNAHDWIAQTLTDVFSGGTAGNLIRQLLALLAIPVLVALIPAMIYWVAKRNWLPYFMHIVWVTWLAQTAALIIQYKAAV